eukprot:861777-Pleurochrysis_carterae.AAC.1
MCIALFSAETTCSGPPFPTSFPAFLSCSLPCSLPCSLLAPSFAPSLPLSPSLPSSLPPFLLLPPFLPPSFLPPSLPPFFLSLSPSLSPSFSFFTLPPTFPPAPLSSLPPTLPLLSPRSLLSRPPSRLEPPLLRSFAPRRPSPLPAPPARLVHLLRVPSPSPSCPSTHYLLASISSSLSSPPLPPVHGRLRTPPQLLLNSFSCPLNSHSDSSQSLQPREGLWTSPVRFYRLYHLGSEQFALVLPLPSSLFRIAKAGTPCWNSVFGGIDYRGLAISNKKVSICWAGGSAESGHGGKYLNNHNWVEYVAQDTQVRPQVGRSNS